MFFNSNSSAFWFIKEANSWILPPTYSANATAASFPDLNINPYNKSLTVILSLAFNFNLEPPVPAAFADISTMFFKLVFSITISAVIIFVVDAIFVFVVSFFPYNIALLCLSITTANLEFIFGFSVASLAVSITVPISSISTLSTSSSANTL